MKKWKCSWSDVCQRWQRILLIQGKWARQKQQRPWYDRNPNTTVKLNEDKMNEVSKAISTKSRPDTKLYKLKCQEHNILLVQKTKSCLHPAIAENKVLCSPKILLLQKPKSWIVCVLSVFFCHSVYWVQLNFAVGPKKKTRCSVTDGMTGSGYHVPVAMVPHSCEKLCQLLNEYDRWNHEWCVGYWIWKMINEWIWWLKNQSVMTKCVYTLYTLFCTQVPTAVAYIPTFPSVVNLIAQVAMYWIHCYDHFRFKEYITKLYLHPELPKCTQVM